ncbi:RHS repeat-associated core domain-containing protein [Lysobacter sp. CFH 32150]|uniref:RHS repeat-associated core domain-containing protein n=1 Tax=Lysobacter sp. CFH 32150 TaxID=2927128 RepID=UPI001FA6AEE7|nr:RHS repeat-associated core domain-containing protein [Lysobacter sp. CFH 32150]MCI4567064.1 RHS domain-containing protein [Lysobacter sp. CFH 32150]
MVLVSACLFITTQALAASPVSKPTIVDTSTTIIGADGTITKAKARATSSARSSLHSEAVASPQPGEITACLSAGAWDNCMTDTQMATTDWGMGYNILLDGVTPFYRVEWTQLDGTVYRFRNFYLDDDLCPAPTPENPTNYYLDYNGPFAGDELCWPEGSWQSWWVYPHKAGSYKFRGYINSYPSEPLSNDVGTVVPGTLRIASGSGQSVPATEWALGPLTISISDFRGNPVSYPIETSSTTNRFAFTIAGPTNSTGALADPSAVTPGASGSASARLRTGDKIGQYNVSVTSEDATPLSTPAILFAVSRRPPDDNKDKEEGNGEDCSVADPITIGIGNSFQQETDYARTGLSILEFERSYNALGSKSKLMGNYWTTTFDRAVLPPAIAGEPTRVRRPDGRVIPFTLQGGQYMPLRPYFHGVLRANGSGWQYVTEDNTTESYDSQGKWTTITDATGRTLTATYSSKPWLTKVTANTGESLTFAYNTYGQIISATDHSGRVWTYTYNAWANLTQLKDPDGVYHTYHYESPYSPYLLTGISVGRNATPQASERYVTWTFDANGRAISNYFTGGLKRYDISYNDITGERTVTDALSNQALFQTRTLNGRGFVDAVVGPGFSTCGFADSEIQRDLNMNVTLRTAFGRATQFGNYDSKGQFGFMIEAAGKSTARRSDYTYDPRFIHKPTSISQPSVSAGQIKVTQRAYDAAGNVIQESVSGFRPDGTPISRGVTLQYNGPYGQLSQIDGPRTDVSDITRLEYHATTKRLLRITDPNGIQLRNNITYTATGQVASEDRPNGLHLTYTYYPGTDLLKSVTEAGTGSTRTTTWTYNDRRWVTALSFSDGINTDIATNFEYNAAGDITKVWSPGAGAISYTLDAAGNRKKESYLEDYAGTERRWVQRTFDAYGRTKDLINADNQSQYVVHPEGTLTSSIDGRNNTTSYTYDDFKRLTQTLLPGQVATSYGYDAQDRLISVTDGNQATTALLYDDLGNRIRLESPDTGITTFAHDAAGNVIGSTDALGQATAYTYDAGNRLKTVDRVGTADDESYTFDTCVNGSGRLCIATNGIGDFVRYDYDVLGRAAKQTTNAGVVSYQHDAAGNITEITYPSQRKVRYVYNGGSQVTNVTVIDGGNSYALARNISHLPFGPARSWIYGNGLSETRQYDLQYRPVTFNAGGRSAVSYGSYDGDSNPTQRTLNGDSQALTYDAQARLDTASGAFGTRDYGYDAVGNRTSLSADGQTTSYAYQPQSNRLLSDTQWSYTHDPNGNETRRQALDGHGWDLTYTANNRLMGVTDLESPVTLLGAYRYNALGQRTLKSTPYGDTRFVYGPSGELLAELLPDGSVTQEYVYLDGAPIALLGAPAAPAAPFGVDQTIDNPASDAACSVKRASEAINGNYLLCPRTGSSFQLEWPWEPPYTGDYDLYIRWAWTSDSQCYEFRFVTFPTCVGAGAAAGTWVSLGRHHLVAGTRDPMLSTQANSWNNLSLKMDAIRYVLAYKDVTDRDYKYVHTDALGTPQRATDKLGTVVWQASYDPFGAAVIDDDPDGDSVHQALNLRFPGQYYDAETGLHYNYFRDYDARLGRYLEADPIGLQGGLNLYAYADGNPVATVDPQGLWSASPGQNYGPMYSNNPDRSVYVAPAGYIRYKRGDNTIIPAPGLHGNILCLQLCLGLQLTITGGSEGAPYHAGRNHPAGKACDFGCNSNPALCKIPNGTVTDCAARCGFTNGMRHAPDHWHLSTAPGDRVPSILPPPPALPFGDGPIVPLRFPPP